MFLIGHQRRMEMLVEEKKINSERFFVPTSKLSKKIQREKYKK